MITPRRRPPTLVALVALTLGACGGSTGLGSDGGGGGRGDSSAARAATPDRGGRGGAAAGGGGAFGGAGAAGTTGVGGTAGGGSGGAAGRGDAGGGGTAAGGNGGAAGRGGAGGGGVTAGGGGAAPATCAAPAICLAPPGDGGKLPAAAYGPNGDLHVAYVDATTAQPRHAFKENGIWTSESSTRSPPAIRLSRSPWSSTGSGASTSSTRSLTRSGCDHRSNVWYAQRDPGGTTSAPVMLAGPTDSTNFVLYAVGVDGNNEPFVASQYVRQVALSRRSTAGWNEQIFANANSQSSGIAIATDGGGRPWAFSAPLLLRPTATGYTMVSVPVSETRYLAVSSAGDTAYVGSGMSAITYGMDAFWSQEMIPRPRLPYLRSHPDIRRQARRGVHDVDRHGRLRHARLPSRCEQLRQHHPDYPFTALDSNGQHPSNYWGTPMVFDAQLRPVIAGPPDFNGDLRVFELGPQPDQRRRGHQAERRQRARRRRRWGTHHGRLLRRLRL